MSTKLPIVMVALYGAIHRASQLVGRAKALAYKLMPLPEVSTLEQHFDDGSFIVAKRIKHIYTVDIYGAHQYKKSLGIPEKEATVKDEFWLWSGLVTNPLLTYVTSPTGAKQTYITEFSATRTTAQHAKGKISRRDRAEVERIITPPAVDFLVSPIDDKYSQAGYITPSMFSGTMKGVVQAVLGIGDLGENGAKGGRPAGYPIEYGCTFYATHGCVQATDKSWWLVEISPLGVVAGRLPVMDIRHSDDPFFVMMGGVPTGGLPSSVIVLATAEDMSPFYTDKTPVLDVWHGWVFNTSGKTAMNVCAAKYDTHWQSYVYSLDITINPKDINACKAVLTQRAEGRLNSPQRWWEDSDAQTLYLPSMGWQYQNAPVLPLGTMAWDDIANDTWLPSGTHPSFLNRAAPVQVFTRSSGTTGIAASVVFPEAGLNKGRTVVDAPVFVTCIHDKFHVVKHYWRMQPIGGFFKHPNGWQHCDVSNDAATPGCWYIHSGIIGTPPTFYSNVYDSRVDTCFAIDIVDPNATRYGQMCTQCGKPPIIPAAYITTQFKRTQWLCHTELYLPFMCREDYQLLDLDCVGSGAVTHTDGEVYGIERVYMYAPPYKFGSTNSDARLLGKNARRKIETFGIYPFTMENGVTYTAAIGCHSDWRMPLSVRADKTYTIEGLSTRLTTARQLTTKPDLYIQAYEEIVPVAGYDVPLYYYRHAQNMELFQCWHPPGTTNESWFSTLFFEDKTSPLCAVSRDMIDDVRRLAESADINLYGEGTEVVHTENNGYNISHWYFNGYIWQNKPPPYPAMQYNDAPQPYAAWKDKTQLITYSNGLPSTYALPKVSRLNANQMRRTMVNAPTSSASAIGKRFAMFASPLDGKVVSFGAVPASITLNSDDVVCPIGVNENG